MTSITETLEILNNMKEGKINQFALQKFTIDHTTTKALIQGIPIGNYIQLTNSQLYESIIMSTTPMEVRTNYKIITEAYGGCVNSWLGFRINHPTYTI